MPREKTPRRTQVRTTQTSSEGWTNIQTATPSMRTEGRQAALDIGMSLPLRIERYPIGKLAMKPAMMMSAAESPARVSLYPLEQSICSSLVCRVLMYPMAPPRKKKMMMKGLLVASCLMVPRKGGLLTVLARAALGEGGVGGREDLTPRTVRRNPGTAGRNQTRLSRGNWEGWLTRREVRS